MTEVLEKFYELVRAACDDIVNKIVLLDTDQNVLVTVTKGDSATGKEYSFSVDNAAKKIVVTAVVSPSHQDVPEDTYWGSRLEDSNGNPLTANVSHGNVTLSEDEDTLTSVHEVEIPDQSE